MSHASPSSASEPALAISGLRKAFGDTVAVDGVSLTVSPGSMYGLVGPNGAGSARIFGVDVWRNPVRATALIGVLPDGFAMPHRLTGRELLTYLGLLRGMDPATVDARTASLLAVFDLAGAERTLIVEYSAGMRGKIVLACWTLCWIPLFPQGLVPLAMTLTGNEVQSWFLAFYVPDILRWPVMLGMIALGLGMLATAVTLTRQLATPQGG